MFRLITGTFLGGALLGCAYRGPCPKGDCSNLCPAGTTVDWKSELARTCDVGADVDVTVATEGGKGGFKTRCERSGGVTFLCRPGDVCSKYGVKMLTREAILCNDPASVPPDKPNCGPCDQLAECGFVDRDQCVKGCEMVRAQALHDRSCSAQLHVRDRCLEALGCDELRRYNDALGTGTIRSAPCGAQENGMIFACMPGADVCRQLCGKLNSCGLQNEDYLQCGVQCVGSYQAAGGRRGQVCYESLMKLHYCRVKSYSCAEHRATGTDAGAPERCADERAAVKSACGVDAGALPLSPDLF